MDHEAAVREAFPELHEIADSDLRDRVVAVWADALADSDYDSIDDVPWWPPLAAELEGAVGTVPHVRDVTGIAIALADAAADRFAVDVDRDAVVAGALLHDVSKLYELTGTTTNERNELVPHPHYGVHVLAEAGFSTRFQHVALSHSDSSAVEPRTFEARIVALADRFAVDGLFVERTGELPSDRS
jgi:putative nucleotidyltransferase with HDIG domain